VFSDCVDHSWNVLVNVNRHPRITALHDARLLGVFAWRMI
jgi:hypothetical protein